MMSSLASTLGRTKWSRKRLDNVSYAFTTNYSSPSPSFHFRHVIYFNIIFYWIAYLQVLNKWVHLKTKGRRNGCIPLFFYTKWKRHSPRNFCLIGNSLIFYIPENVHSSTNLQYATLFFFLSIPWYVFDKTNLSKYTRLHT